MVNFAEWTFWNWYWLTVVINLLIVKTVIYFNGQPKDDNVPAVWIGILFPIVNMIMLSIGVFIAFLLLIQAIIFVGPERKNDD